MEVEDIIKKYSELIQDEFSSADLTLILYGSTVYGVRTSDLDLCFISDDKFDDVQFQKLRKMTIQFHEEFKFKIDEEIAYEDKLVYQKSFIEEAITNLPFPMIDGKYYIPPIEKTNDFLTSSDMKKRLLLNIFTVKRQILFGDEELVDYYSRIAWENIIKVVISYCELNDFDIDTFVNLLYEDPFNGNKGEMYLGYKDNLTGKMEYLKNAVSESLIELENQHKLVKIKKLYAVGNDWRND